MIDKGEIKNQSDLARKICVSRVTVNQYIALLKLDPDVIKTIESIGDPMLKCYISKRKLLSLAKLPSAKQKAIIQTLKF